MRFLSALAAALTLLALPALAAAGEAADRNPPASPILIQGTQKAERVVTYNHSTHAGIACKTCHHKDPINVGTHQPCRKCHSLPGVGSRDPQSTFSAMHIKTSAHSCVGCHAKLFKEAPAEHPTFRNCSPCHRKPGQN